MNNLRNLALWILIALLLVLLFNLFQGSNKSAQAAPYTYTAFTQEVVKGNVQEITLSGDQVKGKLRSGTEFTTMVPPNDQTMWTTLKEHDVNVTVAKPDDGMSPLLNVLVSWFPMLLLIAV